VPAPERDPAGARTEARPRRDTEPLDLGCAPVRTEADHAGVACRWSPSHSPAFASYELWRAGPGPTPRTMVFTTTDRGTTHHLDQPVEPGAYHYAVLAKDAGGELVGRSRVVEVHVGPRPDRPVEPLRLECRGGTPEGRPVIGCRWSPSQSRQFAGYRLVRQGPDGARHVVFRTGDRSQTHHVDDDVRPGATYHYKVVAVDAGEHVVGESRVVAASTGPAAVPAGDVRTR